MPSSDVMETVVQAHVCAPNNADRNAMVARAPAFEFNVAFFGPAKRGHA